MSLKSFWLQPMRPPLHSPVLTALLQSRPAFFIVLLISSFSFFFFFFFSIVFPSLHLPALLSAVYPLTPPDSLLPPSLPLIYLQRTCLPLLSLLLGLRPNMLTSLLLNPRGYSSWLQFIIVCLHLYKDNVLGSAIASAGVYLMIRQGLHEWRDVSSSAAHVEVQDHASYFFLQEERKRCEAVQSHNDIKEY